MKYFSTFSGIGGFELGIIQAYESLCDANRGKERGGEKHSSGDKGSRLQSETRQDTCTEEGSASERSTDRTYQRPLCVGYSEIDKYATQIYQKHFPNHKNYGDITKIDPTHLPDFDLLVGGFPCQAFSIAGKRRGFSDTRGTLFFEIARIAKEKQPRLLLLENVKGLLSHDQGRTFYTIITTLDELGYDCQWQVLNSKNHGVPQNRERVFIIGHLRGTTRPEVFPFVGDDEAALELSGQQTNTLTARYEGAQATGSYIVEGELNAQEIKQALTQDALIRRLTPTECERLQGFPDGWTEIGSAKCSTPNSCPPPMRTMCTGHDVKISDAQRYKCCGNAVTVNVIRDIMVRLMV